MSDTIKIIIGLFGAVVTLSIFVMTVTFRLGHHAARIEALELWRVNVRSDMHEISEKMEALSGQMTELMTLIKERTERRFGARE